MLDRRWNLNATVVHCRCSPRVSVEAMAKALVVDLQVSGARQPARAHNKTNGEGSQMATCTCHKRWKCSYATTLAHWNVLARSSFAELLLTQAARSSHVKSLVKGQWFTITKEKHIWSLSFCRVRLLIIMIAKQAEDGATTTWVAINTWCSHVHHGREDFSPQTRTSVKHNQTTTTTKRKKGARTVVRRVCMRHSAIRCLWLGPPDTQARIVAMRCGFLEESWTLCRGHRKHGPAVCIPCTRACVWFLLILILAFLGT